ncbi:MAG: hypothetical protein AB9846_02785 [Tenuifilaceae bacterium]
MKKTKLSDVVIEKVYRINNLAHRTKSFLVVTTRSTKVFAIQKRHHAVRPSDAHSHHPPVWSPLSCTAYPSC